MSVAQNIFQVASLKFSTSCSKDESMTECSLSPFSPLLEHWTMISNFLSDNSKHFLALKHCEKNLYEILLKF